MSKITQLINSSPILYPLSGSSLTSTYLRKPRSRIRSLHGHCPLPTSPHLRLHLPRPTLGLENPQPIMKTGWVYQLLLLTVLDETQMFHVTIVKGDGELKLQKEHWLGHKTGCRNIFFKCNLGLLTEPLWVLVCSSEKRDSNGTCLI